MTAEEVTSPNRHIKLLVHVARLTPSEVAKALGVTPRTICVALQGNPVRRATKIAAKLLWQRSYAKTYAPKERLEPVKQTATAAVASTPKPQVVEEKKADTTRMVIVEADEETFDLIANTINAVVPQEKYRLKIIR